MSSSSSSDSKTEIVEKVTYTTPESYLFAVNVPKETRTYKPISHRELADVTLEAISEAGFKLGRHEYRSAKNGNVANGRYTITDVADSEMQLEIGWQNSYDKTLSLKFAIGTRILICDNGCVSGDLGAFKKKHMGKIEEFAPEQISKAIADAGDLFRKIQEQRDAMKEIEVDKRIRAELVGRMFLEQEIINSTQLNIIRNEFRKPTFDYKCENSLWELYQHTTFAMKELHPSTWMSDHIKVHNFFSKDGFEMWGDKTLHKEAMKSLSHFSKEEILSGHSNIVINKVDPRQIDLIDAIEETGK